MASGGRQPAVSRPLFRHRYFIIATSSPATSSPATSSPPRRSLNTKAQP